MSHAGFADGGTVERDAVTSQLAPRGDRVDVRSDVPFVGEYRRGLQGVGHRHAGDEDVGVELLVRRCLLVEVHALEQARDVEVLRLRRLADRLVVHGEVVVDVLRLVAVHATQPVLDDVRELVGERGIVGHHRGVGCGEQRRVAVGVLQTFTGQRGAAGGGADDEAACHLVGRGPEAVARALEAEHRIEDVERNHRFAMRGVRRPDRSERSGRSGLVDALVEDLPLRALLVSEHQLSVDRGVELPVAVVDLESREPGVHAECARLVGDDRHDALADLLVAQQFFEDAHQCHRRRDLLLARPLCRRLDRAAEIGFECLRRRAAGREEAAELLAAIEHVLDLRRIHPGVVVGREVRILLEFGVADRDTYGIAERLEVVEGQLLHLVRRVATLEVLTERVALDGVREDHRRLTLVCER